MRCKHKYGKVQKDGYQYCESCGKAIVAPCKHDWQRIKEIELEHFGQKSGHIFVDECSKCHEIRKESITPPWMNYWYSSPFGGGGMI
jgi:hypothetical protein